MTTAKRRLTDIKFEHEGAHVALVGKHQGGPANGVTTLVYKALNVPEELIQKASEVTVTLSFHDFLRKFFGMYWEDANILARALGFEGEPESPVDYKEYIDSKVEAISILKNVYKSQDIPAALGELSPEDSLAILVAQETLEKAMSSAMPEGELTPPLPIIEDTMEKIEKALHEELLNKAVADVEVVLKAQLQEQADVLKSLQDEVAVFKEAAAVAKATQRKEVLKAAKLSDEEVEAIYKAVGDVSDEAFEVLAKQFAAKAVLADESDLFKESGVSGAGEQDAKEVDGTAAILKARYSK
ncbi:hypothetical protein D3C85_607390 [compost metagenome]